MQASSCLTLKFKARSRVAHSNSHQSIARGLVRGNVTDILQQRKTKLHLANLIPKPQSYFRKTSQENDYHHSLRLPPFPLVSRLALEHSSSRQWTQNEEHGNFKLETLRQQRENLSSYIWYWKRFRSYIVAAMWTFVESKFWVIWFLSFQNSLKLISFFLALVEYRREISQDRRSHPFQINKDFPQNTEISFSKHVEKNNWKSWNFSSFSALLSSSRKTKYDITKQRDSFQRRERIFSLFSQSLSFEV